MNNQRRNRMLVKLNPYDDQLDLGDDLHSEARLPIRAHHDDAGWDLYVSRDTVIPPHGFVDVATGVHVQLPNGYWGMLTGRSSTIRKLGLLVVQGIIDTGYTGELFSAVWNLTNEPVTIRRGDRVAQLVILPNSTASTVIRQVDSFDGKTTRGSNGFGSSGI